MAKSKSPVAPATAVAPASAGPNGPPGPGAPPAAGAPVRPPRGPRPGAPGSSRCNPRRNRPDWNPLVRAQGPALYAAASRPGRVVTTGHFGTHLGNNSFVAYDGRVVVPVPAPSQLTRTFEKMSSHAVREIAKGILWRHPEYALDTTRFGAELLKQCAAHGLPRRHHAAGLTDQDYMDLLSVVSLSQISDAIRTMKNRDAEIEMRNQQIWWQARGITPTNNAAQRRVAYDAYAARLYATALQTSVALGIRTNELQQTRLAPRSVAVAPRIAAVHLDPNDVPTRRRAARADATAVLASV